MQIELPEDAIKLSLAAGFASVDQFINSLLHKERERLAIQEGIDAMEKGEAEDLSEFDRRFRQKNGLKSR